MTVKSMCQNLISSHGGLLTRIKSKLYHQNKPIRNKSKPNKRFQPSAIPQTRRVALLLFHPIG